MQKQVAKYFLLATALMTGCQVSRQTTQMDYPLEEGVASWYGPGFQGKKTANGERFNTNQLTAAHRTLPFDTWVKVVNLQNGQSVRVRINDRGPYAKERIIDLSQAAARKLNMLEQGTTPVRLYVEEKVAGSLKLENLKKASYTVQIASFSSRTEAEVAAAKHADGWVKASNVSGEKVYRVFLGKFSSKEQAEARKRQLAIESGFIKQVEN